MAWVYGKYFELDINIQLFGIDEEAMLKLKRNPAKLDGRAERLARTETIERMCSRIRAAYEEDATTGIVDEEPDLISERLAAKALRRKHLSAQRYRKVRQEYAAPGNFDLRAFKKEARRRRRRQLNGKAAACEKDVVRKYRSTFSDAEPYSIKGMKLLDGHISGFGSFDL